MGELHEKSKIFTITGYGGYRYLAITDAINLPWAIAQLILVGKVPFVDFNIGFLGSLIILSFLGMFVGKIVYDARIDMYDAAIERSKQREIAVAEQIGAADILSAATEIEDLDVDAEDLVVA